MLGSKPLSDFIGGHIPGTEFHFVDGRQVAEIILGDRIVINCASILIGSTFPRDEQLDQSEISNEIGATNVTQTALRKHPQVIGELIAYQKLGLTDPQRETSSELHLVFSLFQSRLHPQPQQPTRLRR